MEISPRSWKYKDRAEARSLNSRSRFEKDLCRGKSDTLENRIC